MKFLILSAILFCILPAKQSSRDAYKFNYAESLLKQGKTKDAVQLFKELYQSNSENTKFYNGYKEALLSEGNYIDAIKVIEFRKLRYPQDLNTYNDLASVYFKSGQLPMAFKIWNDAIELPSNQQFHFSMIANAMVRERLYDKAIDVYLYAQKKLKNPHLYLYEIARFYQYRMSYDKAFLAYLDVLQMDDRQYAFVRSQIFRMYESPDGKAQIDSNLNALNLKLALHLEFLVDIHLKAERFSEALNVFKTYAFHSNTKLFELANEALKLGKYQLVDDVCELIKTRAESKKETYHAQLLHVKSLIQRYEISESDALKSQIDPMVHTVQNTQFDFILQKIYIEHLLYKRHDYGQSETEILRLRDLGKRFQDASFYQGELLFFQGEFRMAEQSFKQVFGLYESEVLLRKLIIHLIENNPTSFQEEFNQMLRQRHSVKNPFLNDALRYFVDASSLKEKATLYGKMLHAYSKRDYKKSFELLDQLPEFGLNADRLKFQFFIDTKQTAAAYHIIEKYQSSKHVDEWQFKQAKLLLSENKKAEAKTTLESLILNHPQSFWVSAARMLLAQ